ncbi:MAG: SoxR reducing system RseC family protein [Gallionellaceae bacterium]|nr:SoxR reducing system RseC family protein [Gallionellaceae bacterium]
MIETPARVTRLEGDSAWVVSAAPSSCGACGGKGCGSSLFARVLHADEPEYRVENPIGAAVGESVVVGLPDGALLGAALSGYLVPLMLLLLGAGAGQHFAGELGAVAGGLLGLVLAALYLKRRSAPVSYPVVLRRGETSCASR